MADELRDIDPRILVALEERATATYDDEQREALKANIQIEGIRDRLLVYDVDGELIVTDGLNRATIAEELQLATVPCRVRKGSLEDALLENLTANHVRGKNRPGEMAQLVVKLRVEHGVEPEEIHKRTGLSTTWVKKLLALEDATPAVLTAIDSGAIALGVALELVQLKDNDVQNRALVLAQNQGWTVAHAKLMIPAILEEAEKPVELQRALEDVPPPTVTCQLCREPHDPREVKGALVCEGCWGLAVVSVRDIRSAPEAG